MTCLQVQRTEDIPPWFGASDLIAVVTDSEFVLERAEWEMLGFDVIAAYETEARSER